MGREYLNSTYKRVNRFNQICVFKCSKLINTVPLFHIECKYILIIFHSSVFICKIFLNNQDSGIYSESISLFVVSARFIQIIKISLVLLVDFSCQKDFIYIYIKMFSIPSFCEVWSFSDSYDIDHLGKSDDNYIETTNLSPRSMAEAKAVAASNSHKEAERRRRKRINAHIATLKAILPNTIKTDKASLLGEAVRCVKELKKTTSDLAAKEETCCYNNYYNPDPDTTALKFAFPSETNELKVCHCEGDPGLIKVTLCCGDRPEIIAEIIQALKSVEAKVVRAEMATVGGMTKSVLWVKLVPAVSSSAVISDGTNIDLCLGKLKKALKIVMDRPSLSADSGRAFTGNKRQRFYHHFG